MEKFGYEPSTAYTHEISCKFPSIIRLKKFVFDDECAYIGSANITAAAIGKRASGSRNHEAGILVWDPTMIQAPLHHFERAWNDPDILKSIWKRFATKAKELDKELKERYGK